MPIVNAARLAAVATPDPPDEPPAARSVAYGLRVSPPMPDCERMPELAHSSRFVLPIAIARPHGAARSAMCRAPA